MFCDIFLIIDQSRVADHSVVQDTSVESDQHAQVNVEVGHGSNAEIKEAENESSFRISPISELTMFSSDQWIIKVRVLHCPDKTISYSNSKGSGSFVKAEVIDRNGTRIVITGYGGTAERMVKSLSAGKVYLLSRGVVRESKPGKKYNNINNTYSITFNDSSVIKECKDDPNIPYFKYNLKTIEEVLQFEEETLVDVCGIVLEIGELLTILSQKNNNELQKRRIRICDQTGKSVFVDCWNDVAKNLKLNIHDAVIVECGSINYYNGRKTINCNRNVITNPKISATIKLKKWWSLKGRKEVNFTNASKKYVKINCII